MNSRLVEICEAFECGPILNPLGLRSQVEGCIIMGLGAALREEMLFENGKLTNGRFSAYRVPRFRDVPKMDLVLLDRKDLEPAGAGETPIIAVAPAMANAIFDATGERLRSLPLRPPQVLKVGRRLAAGPLARLRLSPVGNLVRLAGPPQCLWHDLDQRHSPVEFSPA